jgi:hypothetical protein
MTLKEALEDIEIAFLQLEFAIKLLSYCELKKINAPDFDTDHTVILQNGNLEFPTGYFRDPDNIIKAAKVTVSLAFGASAFALDKAYEVAGVPKDPLSDDNAVRLRTLIYMVRCAYAHGIADPKWEVRGAYKRSMTLNLTNECLIKINFGELDGQDFNFEHLGGHGSWFLIRNAAVETLRKAQD